MKIITPVVDRAGRGKSTLERERVLKSSRNAIMLSPSKSLARDNHAAFANAKHKSARLIISEGLGAESVTKRVEAAIKRAATENVVISMTHTGWLVLPPQLRDRINNSQLWEHVWDEMPPGLERVEIQWDQHVTEKLILKKKTKNSNQYVIRNIDHEELIYQTDGDGGKSETVAALFAKMRTGNYDLYKVADRPADHQSDFVLVLNSNAFLNNTRILSASTRHDLWFNHFLPTCKDVSIATPVYANPDDTSPYHTFHNVTLTYLTEANNSSYMRTRFPDEYKRMYSILDGSVEGERLVFGNVEDRKFAFTNVAKRLGDDGTDIDGMLTHNVHGLNAFRDVDNIIVTYVANPSSQQMNFYKSLGITADEVFADQLETVMQVVFRTSLRDNARPHNVLIRCVDRRTVDGLNELHLGGTGNVSWYPNDLVLSVEKKEKLSQQQRNKASAMRKNVPSHLERAFAFTKDTRELLTTYGSLFTSTGKFIKTEAQDA